MTISTVKSADMEPAYKELAHKEPAYKEPAYKDLSVKRNWFSFPNLKQVNSSLYNYKELRS